MFRRALDRYAERHLDPEQLERLRARRERFAWVQRGETIALWAWLIMMVVGALVWFALL